MGFSPTSEAATMVTETTEDTWSVGPAGDNTAANSTANPDDEIFKRLTWFMDHPYMVHVMNIYFVFPWLNLIIGLPGSVTSFFVILRMKPFTSSSLYFCALAVADGVFVVFVMLNNYSYAISMEFLNLICITSEGIWDMLTMFPNLILIVLAGERCLAVLFPLKVTLITSVKKASVICAVSVVFSVGSSAYNFFVWRIDQYGSCSNSAIPGAYEFFLNVWTKLMPILFSLIPTIIVLVLNITIVSGLRKSNKMRQDMTTGDDKIYKDTQSQSKQVTVMLVSISVIFIVTNLPYGIFNVFGYVGGWIVLDADPQLMYTFKHVESTLMLTFFTMWRDMNHSLNFVCYFFCARRFRKELKDFIFSFVTIYRHCREKTLTCKSSKAATSKMTLGTSLSQTSDSTHP